MSNVLDSLEIENISESLSNISLSDPEIPIGNQLPRTPISITSPVKLDEDLYKLDARELNFSATNQANLENQSIEEEKVNTFTPKVKRSFKAISRKIFRKTRSNPFYVTVGGLDREPPRKQWARYQDKLKNIPSLRERLSNFTKKESVENICDNQLVANKSESEDGKSDQESPTSERSYFQKRQRSSSSGPSELRRNRKSIEEVNRIRNNYKKHRHEKRRKFETDHIFSRGNSFDGDGTLTITPPFSPLFNELTEFSDPSTIPRKYKNRSHSVPNICEALTETYREFSQSLKMCDDNHYQKDVSFKQTSQFDSDQWESFCEPQTMAQDEGMPTLKINEVDNSSVEKTQIFPFSVSVNLPNRCRVYSKLFRKTKSDSSLWEHNSISRGTIGGIRTDLLLQQPTPKTENRPYKSKTTVYKPSTRKTRANRSQPYPTKFKFKTVGSKINTTNTPTAKGFVKPTTHPTSSNSNTNPPIPAGNTTNSTPTSKTTNPTTSSTHFITLPQSGLSASATSYQSNPTTSRIPNSPGHSNNTQSNVQSRPPATFRNSQNTQSNSNSTQSSVNAMSLTPAQTQALANNFTDLHKGQRALTLLLQIPIFSGSPAVRFDRWIKQFENVVNMSNWTDDEKVNMLTTKMTDKAYDILQNILESHTTSYNDIKQLLQDRFHGNETEDYHEKKFDKCERKPLESVLDFAFRLKTVFNRAYPPRPNETAHETAAKLKFLRQKFLQGLDINLRNKIKYKNLTTFEDLVKEAQKYAIRLDADKEEKDKREFINAVNPTANLATIPEIKTIITETVNAVTSSFKPHQNFNKPVQGDGKINQTGYTSSHYQGQGNNFLQKGPRPNFSRPQHSFHNPNHNGYHSNQFRPQSQNFYSQNLSNVKPTSRPTFHQQNFQLPTIHCGYCGYPGHTRNNCNTLRRHQSQPTKNFPICVNCNESGHYALVCPRNTSRSSNQHPSAGNA